MKFNNKHLTDRNGWSPRSSLYVVSQLSVQVAWKKNVESNFTVRLQGIDYLCRKFNLFKLQRHQRERECVCVCVWLY